MAADVQSGAALAGRLYIDVRANPRSGRLIAPLSSAADHQKCCDTFAGYRVVYAVDA